MKKILILSSLLCLLISIPPVFASQINQTLTYDGNGNLITGDGKYREYNEFNQLIRVYDGSYPNGTILESYLYSPTEDKILIKYGSYSSTNPDEAVVYVNDNLEKTYDALSGTPRVNYTYYTSDENGLVGEIVKNNTNATLRTLYYHNDYSGGVSLITNGSGGVVEQTFYDPFGAILGGGDVSRYSYEGKEFSSVTDDFDFHFRKYDPSLMIFTQPDSVISNVYDPQSLNRYSFERNNPYKYVDKDGKFILLAAMAIGAGIGLATYFIQHALTDKQYTFRGALAYAAGGALAALGGEAVLALGGLLEIGTAGYSGLALTGVSGAAESGIFQSAQNFGDEKPIGSNIGEAFIVGSITSIGRDILLPSPWESSLKKFSSAFITKTGQRYIMNTIIQSEADFLLNYAYDLAKQASSNNAHSSSGGNTDYCLNGQCYSGIQPKDTYDYLNGVYIDKNGNGYSVSSNNLNKLKAGGI